VDALALDYRSERVGRSLVVHTDCLEWLGRIPEESLHGVVTDSPYGVEEFDADQMEKRENGRGGIWRPRLCDEVGPARHLLREF
jgi:site-specific DNA-methyltransferase (adenine-specific)